MRPRRHADMADVNESLVLEHFRSEKTSNRADAARALGLSPPTVGRATARLIAEEKLVEEGSIVRGTGRPPGLVSFNPRHGAIIAVDLGGTKCAVAVADMAGEILYESSCASWRHDEPAPIEALTTVFRRARDFCSNQADLPIECVAVGVPGIVDVRSGVVLEAPNIAWYDVSLQEILQAEFGDDPILVVDNDVNFAAYAHHWIGAAAGLGDFAVVAIGTGVGGAIFAGGSLLRGRHSAGGEIGFIVPGFDLLQDDRGGGLGVFERIISGPGIVARWVERSGNADPDPDAGARPVFDAAAAGDPAAIHVIEETTRYLLVALVSLSAFVDPEVIVIDGGVGRALGDYLEPVRAGLAAHLPRPPDIVVSTLEHHAPLVGGIRGAMLAAAGPARASVAPPVLGVRA